MPIQHLYTYPTCIRMFIHEETQSSKTLLAYHCIRIKQQNILSVALTDRLIIGLSKSRIILILYNVTSGNRGRR